MSTKPIFLSRATALLLAFVLAGCATTGLRTAVTPEAAGLSGERLKAVGAIVQEGVDKREIPGAVVLLARRGQVAYLRAVGWRDPAGQAPMTDDAIFRIASMTKPVTTVAAMVLVDAGRLDLAAPVSRYLPEFAGTMVGVESRDAAGKPGLTLEPPRREMTVLDLMRHTSGLTYAFLGQSLVKDRYESDGVEDANQSNAQMSAKLARIPLQSQPGSVWDYSMSTDVLGRVVEVAGGMTLGAFFEQRIFRPLGMADSGFLVADAARRARVASTLVDPATGRPTPMPDPSVKAWESGGGGLVSTAADYARFLQMLLNGGELDGVRILSRAAVERMTRDQLPPGLPTLSTRIPAIDVRESAGNGFGLGFMVRTAEGRGPVRGSLGDYTWSGIFGTYFWVDPKRELVGIVMMQTPGRAFPRTAGYWVRIRNQVYDALVD